jgi:hypothetical protein
MAETATSLAMHYRRRSEEIRLSAETQDGPTREKLLQLAEGYESAATFHEQTSVRTVKKPPFGSDSDTKIRGWR